MTGLPTEVDVAILGGGVAGLTLALQLHKQRPDTRIAVLERQSHPVPETTHKVGESTVEIAGYYLRQVLGLQEHLQAEQLNKFGLRVFFSHNGNDDITRRIELGHSVRPPGAVGTYQLDRGRLENALGRMLVDGGVQFVSGVKVEAVELQPDSDHHRVTVRDADEVVGEIQAKWVVDGTGRSALLKRKLGLAKKVGHRANAVWFRIAHPIDIDRWSDDPDWRGRIVEGRRELSTNHLMGPGYWVWLIRLGSGGISIGIVTDADVHAFGELNTFDKAMQWLTEHEPQCARIIEEHRDKLQDFRIMKDYAYSSEQVFSSDRWCLAGEAGVFLDPFYSPGLDLIAISNGLIADLVGRALDGEDVEETAAIHNTVFFLLTDGWLTIYENQYPLMGNARVMTCKVVWDTAVYWAVPGLLYFQDKWRVLADHPGLLEGLARFGTNSKEVQRFFREWGAVDKESPDQAAFTRFYDFDFMPRLHIGMTADLGEVDLQERFEANVRFIDQLSGQMIATVLAEFEADSGSLAKQEQAQRWRKDEILMSLVEVYEAEQPANPVDDHWITLRPAVETGAGDGR
ncbi:NAD(P)/FAD-dependent oxidoreductase [Kribbella sp. NPDC056345]|uniref:NAD(P)/FAD-dependent oxidoreductase n=1 Tax=Kribbella sp. NPDC056345 TaxID=3345789 RepID=UPI0035D6804D